MAISLALHHSPASHAHLAHRLKPRRSKRIERLLSLQGSIPQHGRQTSRERDFRHGVGGLSQSLDIAVKVRVGVGGSEKRVVNRKDRIRIKQRRQDEQRSLGVHAACDEASTLSPQ